MVKNLLFFEPDDLDSSMKFVGESDLGLHDHYVVWEKKNKKKKKKN